jgi:hypothetical protein
VTDIYTEDLDTPLGVLASLRLDARRLAAQLEHRFQASASNVVDETRFLALKARHRINSRLGMSALIAVGSGLALGLLAAALSTRRRR